MDFMLYYGFEKTRMMHDNIFQNLKFYFIDVFLKDLLQSRFSHTNYYMRNGK